MSFTVAKPQETTPPAKGKGGRPPDPNKLHFRSVGMREKHWRLLTKFFPGEVTEDEWKDFNPTPGLEIVMERIEKTCPDGPYAPIAQAKSRPRQRLPYADLDAYAAEHGLTRYEAQAQIIKSYFSESSKEPVS